MSAPEKIPWAVMHVRITTSEGIGLDALEDLRTDLIRCMDARVEGWGLRVKRRVVSREHLDHLFTLYTDRAAITTQVKWKKRERPPKPSV